MIPEHYINEYVVLFSFLYEGIALKKTSNHIIVLRSLLLATISVNAIANAADFLVRVPTVNVLDWLPFQ